MPLKQLSSEAVSEKGQLRRNMKNLYLASRTTALLAAPTASKINSSDSSQLAKYHTPLFLDCQKKSKTHSWLPKTSNGIEAFTQCAMAANTQYNNKSYVNPTLLGSQAQLNVRCNQRRIQLFFNSNTKCSNKILHALNRCNTIMSIRSLNAAMPVVAA